MHRFRSVEWKMTKKKKILTWKKRTEDDRSCGVVSLRVRDSKQGRTKTMIFHKHGFYVERSSMIICIPGKVWKDLAFAWCKVLS